MGFGACRIKTTRENVVLLGLLGATGQVPFDHSTGLNYSKM